MAREDSNMDTTTKTINIDNEQNVPNQETITAIEATENKQSLSRSFSSVEELFVDLNADD